MTHPYLCAPPTISDGIIDSFLFIQDYRCSLSLADVLDHNRDDLAAKRFYPDQKPAFSNEPQLWAEVLFDPEDIIEIRLRPARPAEKKMRPRKFWATKTANEYGIDLFPFASGINAVVNRLRQLNAGNVTWWGKRKMEHGPTMQAKLATRSTFTPGSILALPAVAPRTKT